MDSKISFEATISSKASLAAANNLSVVFQKQKLAQQLFDF